MEFISVLLAVGILVLMGLAILQATWRVAKFLAIVMATFTVVLVVGFLTEPSTTEHVLREVLRGSEQVITRFWETIQNHR